MLITTLMAVKAWIWATPVRKAAALAFVSTCTSIKRYRAAKANREYFNAQFKRLEIAMKGEQEPKTE